MDTNYDKALQDTDYKDDNEFYQFVELICMAFDKDFDEVAYDLAQYKFYEGSELNRD